MFNDDQRDYMRSLAKMPPETKCYCGWYPVGECYACSKAYPDKTSADRKGDEQIKKLEATLNRYDDADPAEVDSGEYQRLLTELVRLRKERDGKAAKV